MPDQVADLDVVLDLAGVEPVRLVSTLRSGGRFLRFTSRGDAEVQQAARRCGVTAVSLLVEPDGAGLERLVQLVDSGHLHVEIAEALPLADACEAHRRSEHGHTRGKLVLALD